MAQDHKDQQELQDQLVLLVLQDQPDQWAFQESKDPLVKLDQLEAPGPWVRPVHLEIKELQDHQEPQDQLVLRVL